jgi:hypothetical protein
VKARDGAAQETAILGLPPGIDDYCLALADHVEIPLPHRGLDWFTHGRHVLEVMIVPARLVWPGAPQSTYRRRRGVEDVDVELLGDAPRPTGVGVGGKPFVHH